MNATIIKKEDFVVHTWTGGTTAEIYCYPPESSWERKDFEIRISSADCRIDNALYSDFTGYTRHITPLKGHMHMVHRDHHEIQLNPFDVDVFDGAWHTYHTGTAIDFNLLHTNRWKGQMKALTKSDRFSTKSYTIVGFYAIVSTTITVNNNDYLIEQGDFLLLHSFSKPEKIHFTSQTDTPCVICVAVSLK